MEKLDYTDVMTSARPIPPYGLYSATEIERAFGLQERTVAVLQKLEIAPESMGGGGRRKERLFDSRGLSQLAIFAGLFWSGLEMAPAARLARVVSSVFDETYDRPPSRLYENARKWHREIVKICADPDWAAVAEKPRLDDSIIYAAARRDPAYKPGETWKDDIHFELVDRQYGFLGNPSGPKSLSPVGGRKATMVPEFRVVGWTRGGDVVAYRIYDEFPAGWHEQGSPAMLHACAIETEFFQAYDAPRGRLAMNVSLEIRTAHDRIHEVRNTQLASSGNAGDLHEDE